MRPPLTNPFSTRFTKPGAILPLDAGGAVLDVDGLVSAFDRLGGVAAIVGPHGSGKSTLLVHVAAGLERQGRPTELVRVRSWRDVPLVFARLQGRGPHGVLCVDSWECLGSVAGGLLRWIARMSRGGLLVTCHQRAGFPELIRTRTSVCLLQAIIETLPDSTTWFGEAVSASDVADAFVRTRGNLRDALGSLYDLFERRLRQRVDVRPPAAAAG